MSDNGDELDAGQDTGDTAPGDDRVDALDAKVDRLTGLVERVIDSVHGGSQSAVQGRLAAPGDAPGDVAAIVRAELARTDKQARDEKLNQDVETHGQILAKLTEDPPTPPTRRIERIMKWAG